MKVTVDTMRKPAEPKPEFVECAIVELLEIAQRQGITPADFIQLLDSGVHISDFLTAMTPLVNVKRSIDFDS
jgi:3-hydroxyisobutyrate dehydrogenase-like beta-hydroxyacid dehydrogenase